MKPGLQKIPRAAMASLFLANLAAQPDPQWIAVKSFFQGRQMLISYREGSPLHGTYFFLHVHLCEAGAYRSFGESRKQDVLYDQKGEVRHWRDQGTWRVAADDGQIGVRCASSSGQVIFVPVRSWPSRDAKSVSQVSFLPQGAAQCP